MYNKNLVVIFSVLVVVFATSFVFAGDKEYLDQSQPNDIGEYYLINSGRILGQTFQPAYNGRLSSISLKLSKIVPISTDGSPLFPDDFVVEIRTLIENIVPSEEVIASATLNEVQIEEDIPQWYVVKFSMPAYLNKKNKYAIVLKTAKDRDVLPDEPVGSYSLYYEGNNDYDPYTKGELMGRRSIDYYQNWYHNVAWSFVDCTFETYIAKGN